MLLEGRFNNMNYQGPNPETIKSMFKKVAPTYDKGNDILSVGIHHLWRKKLVQMSGAQAGMNILDCATGTGDLAIEFKKAVGPSGSVIGTDFCDDMMLTAPAKAQAQGLEIQYRTADVMNLPFADEEFDRVSISFGIRNVEDPKKALREMARVTKSGGQIFILEFGQMKTPVVKDLYKFYFEKVLPYVGGLVTGQTDAYKYLQKSSSQFPCREEFVSWMDETGLFFKTGFTSVSFGIAYIYWGVKK
jgi:demethylmenaquinone methyltransferase / 2-methoxy-6-polyprenyl-1,4-benzoquinol methylase